MRRILAVADSDSYLKWSAATLAVLPADYQPTQLVVANPLTPSREQGTRPARAMYAWSMPQGCSTSSSSRSLTLCCSLPRVQWWPLWQDD